MGRHDYYRDLAVRFCVGGGYSWRQAADAPGLSGAIGFYGRPTALDEVLDRLQAPLLVLVAGADAHIPVADTLAMVSAVRDRVEVVDVVFDGAPHSFFDRSFAEHTGDCDRAWLAIGAFVSAHR